MIWKKKTLYPSTPVSSHLKYNSHNPLLNLFVIIKKNYLKGLDHQILDMTFGDKYV